MIYNSYQLETIFINELRPLLKGKKYLIADEIYDTGNTFSKVFDCDFCVSYATLVAKILNHNKWVVFPWEGKSN